MAHDHVIRLRLINGPRDYVAYLKGWDNAGTDNSPRWVAVTTSKLDNAMVMADPLDDFTALKATIGPSAMAFLSTLDVEQFVDNTTRKPKRLRSLDPLDKEPADYETMACSECPDRDDCMEAPE